MRHEQLPEATAKAVAAGDGSAPRDRIAWPHAGVRPADHTEEN
jgi:hypothetical protein